MKVDDITHVGVVGAGQMGRGIAQVAAMSGWQVWLVDVSEPVVRSAVERIREGLGHAVEKGTWKTEDVEPCLSRIHPSTQLEPLEAASLVIEAVPEHPELKCRLFQDLAARCPPEAILASNTSSISITRLGAAAERPERVVGMHFMNPVPVMRLVEIVKGLDTSQDTLTLAMAVAERMGKTPILSQDMPGFLVNRVLMPMINEAVFALQEGVGTAEAIDLGMTAGANHPVGPLALADRIGLDTVLAICEILHNDLGDPKFRPCPLLRKYVEAGRLGRKTGRGFYHYA